MANAKPISAPDSGDPAAAQEISMPPLVAVKAAKAPVVDVAALQAVADAAAAEGLAAQVVGNAVRVDY